MFKIVVLVSGKGSNLNAIINAINNRILEHVEIIKVIGDRSCLALEVADKNKIDWCLIDRKNENFSKMLLESIPFDADLIVLAGFLSILDINFINIWTNKVINIHPSLLPKYGGIGMIDIKVHEAVINNKELESGCSVHIVDQEVDRGKVILQKKIPISNFDTPQGIQKKILKLEHEAIVMVINGIKDKEIILC